MQSEEGSGILYFNLFLLSNNSALSESCVFFLLNWKP